MKDTILVLLGIFVPVGFIFWTTGAWVVFSTIVILLLFNGFLFWMFTEVSGGDKARGII